MIHNKTPKMDRQTSRSEDRNLGIDTEINQRLNAFIEANSKLKDYYAILINEHPDVAMRALMLNKMFKYESQQRQTARQAPVAREWLDKQDPGLKEQIMARLEKINPLIRDKVLIWEVAKEKYRADFNRRFFRSKMSI